MNKTIDVIVIGTDPPCPRCDLLDVLVTEAAPPDVTVNVQHWPFDSPDAQVFGRQLGNKVGTAKQVAQDAGISMDWDDVYGIIETRKSSLAPGFRPGDAWTPELDDALRPCQNAAKPTGYLMTPILVVNGKVVHHGSVPSKEQVAAWLSK